MSERSLDIDLTKNTEIRIDEAVKADNIKEPSEREVQAFRGRIAQVLDRKMTIDRTNVLLPSDLDSYWCPNDSISEAQASQRGFIIDTEYAKRNGLNDQADGKTIVGDVFHMVRPKWMKIEEDKARAHRYYEAHLKDPRKQKEEKDFIANNELESTVGSKVEVVSGAQIDEAINPANK